MQKYFPEKNDVLKFIMESPKGVSKREIVRSFNIAADDRKELRQMLILLAKEGKIIKHRNLWCKIDVQKQAAKDTLITLKIIHENPLKAIVINQEESHDDPLLSKADQLPVIFAKRRVATLRKGEHILGQLTQQNGVQAVLYVSRIARKHQSFLAMFQQGTDQKPSVLKPIHKGKRDVYMVQKEHQLGAQNGDLVRAEPLKGAQRYQQGASFAKIIKVLSLDKDALALNEIALVEHNIPTEFSQAALNEAQKLGAPKLDNRVDLRHIPFVTIDGSDAKDFDDAVFANYDDNASCFHIYVAIADVSWYVKPQSALDNEALERGNSVYLPGMVVPMLPEHLSNGWCSLNPDEDRAALVCEMVLDSCGALSKFKFYRAMIRSHARLTYAQAHGFYQGHKDIVKQSETHASLHHLHSAWQLRDNMRTIRGALDLQSDERKVYVNEQGEIEAIKPAISYESNQIIEEMMILANIAAAMQLEKAKFDQKKLCMYRVHAPPSSERLNDLLPLFQSLGIKAGHMRSPSPQDINGILQQAKDKKVGHLVSKAVLRCQSQAQYSPVNEGHYGLALPKYCHFTSPIRRYPDLLVHRALIDACALGEGGLGSKHASFEELAEHCCLTERRAAMAERDTLDRLTAQFLAPKQGAIFQASIDGLNRNGIFLTLEETGASGFCPMSKLPWDQYVYDEQQQAIISLTVRKGYRLGDVVRAKLVEVSPMAGSMIFEIMDMPQHRIEKPKHLRKYVANKAHKSRKKNRRR